MPCIPHCTSRVITAGSIPLVNCILVVLALCLEGDLFAFLPQYGALWPVGTSLCVTSSTYPPALGPARAFVKETGMSSRLLTSCPILCDPLLRRPQRLLQEDRPAGKNLQFPVLGILMEGLDALREVARPVSRGSQPELRWGL
jgi:hypothetical protein